MKVLLLFPPNWSAAVCAPHLALPLLAGEARAVGLSCEIWDLNLKFIRWASTPPSREQIVLAAHAEQFDALDQLYFDWEDCLRRLPLSGFDEVTFRLLSGFEYARARALDLERACSELSKGTPFTTFYLKKVIPEVVAVQPEVIVLTVASQQQLLPAMELLQHIRPALPETLFILGGNVITRLRASPAFRHLERQVDQVVLFQGEQALRSSLLEVTKVGVRAAKRSLANVQGSEAIPFQEWPTPSFNGFQFDDLIGVPCLSYVSTRGCYWGRCHFCAIPAGWSRSAYAGSAPGAFVAGQLAEMTGKSGIHRVKFVDEALPPAKIADLAAGLTAHNARIEWEAYARLDSAWQRPGLFDEAHAAGCRKLYFGLEQAPSTDRSLLGKNDRGNPQLILDACRVAGIKVHLFCMVGHPGSTAADARATVTFLEDNQDGVDTADMVGFRLDRGTTVPGVRARPENASDWALSLPFEPTDSGVLDAQQVAALEEECQERLWEAVPRLLHPLYRLVGPWSDVKAAFGEVEDTAAARPEAC